MESSVEDGSRHATVTRLLREFGEGREEAFRELFPLVYEELRRLAHRERRPWGEDHTLNTTALVHEAYLKLAGGERPARAERPAEGGPAAGWRSRAHFKAVAARAMRHVLIDYARRKGAGKRGGGRRPVSLERVERRLPGKAGWGTPADRLATVLSLEAALRRLEERSERQVRIVECRVFGGMTVADTAAALDVSPATVKRGWSLAQAWLYRELRESV